MALWLLPKKPGGRWQMKPLILSWKLLQAGFWSVKRGAQKEFPLGGSRGAAGLMWSGYVEVVVAGSNG